MNEMPPEQHLKSAKWTVDVYDYTQMKVRDYKSDAITVMDGHTSKFIEGVDAEFIERFEGKYHVKFTYAGKVYKTWYDSYKGFSIESMKIKDNSKGKYALHLLVARANKI